MIDFQTLKLIQKTCPNYHVVARSSAKASSVCLCARCRRNAVVDGVTHCRPLLDRLSQLDLPVGYSRVDMGATCDRAQDPQMTLPLVCEPDNGGEVFP